MLIFNAKSTTLGFAICLGFNFRLEYKAGEKTSGTPSARTR